MAFDLLRIRFPVERDHRAGVDQRRKALAERQEATHSGSFATSGAHCVRTVNLTALDMIGRPKPTILCVGNLRVVIYPNDHRPAHVHVVGPDGEAVFILHCPDGPLELRECYGFKLADVARIQIVLAGKLAELCNGWSKLHGNY